MTIKTLLVANRGEIALRVFRTARSMGIKCLAVYTEADSKSLFITEADAAFRIESYLNKEQIIDAAKQLGADTIHPGYGFLAENPEFASMVEDSELTWIGPSPEVIKIMADKLTAKQAAKNSGVPILESSDDLTKGDIVGYPLLVKAVAGGGGKGMHIVESSKDLGEAVEIAQREALSAFGDDRVFLERYLPESRHIEIQILGDTHGNLIHLGERECSIQRRHQKIIEESPSPVISDSTRSDMGEVAINLARSINYYSAGTVEFLFDTESSNFFFLEVNTRLQVEHPVTEEITNIDLVREQIRVASGEQLVHNQGDIEISGHAIEARLYAEDPSTGFLPATGTLATFIPAKEPAIRWDSGVDTGSKIGLEFDPMLAKVTAHGKTRTEATLKLALALDRLHIGGVTTNRDFLKAVLRHNAFITGDTTTNFIEKYASDLETDFEDSELNRAAITAALWLQGENRNKALVLGHIPSGWRNARLPNEWVTLTHRDQEFFVSYRAKRDGSFLVNKTNEVSVHTWSSSFLDIEIDGLRSNVAVTSTNEHLYIQSPKGTIDFEIVPRFKKPELQVPEGGLIAPMPGRVLEIKTAVGNSVPAGQTLILLEAMKMEHHVKAPHAGTVTDIFVTVDQQVPNGMTLLVIEADDSIKHEEKK